jgi:hypothetical protein
MPAAENGGWRGASLISVTRAFCAGKGAAKRLGCTYITRIPLRLNVLRGSDPEVLSDFVRGL